MVHPNLLEELVDSAHRQFSEPNVGQSGQDLLVEAVLVLRDR